MNNLSLILKFGLVGLSILMVVLFAAGALSVTGLIVFSEVLIVALIASTLIFSGLNLAENPKSGIRLLIGIGGLILCYLVGLGMSSEVIDAETGLVIEGSKQAEAGIRAFWMMGSIAVLAILWSSIKKLIA